MSNVYFDAMVKVAGALGQFGEMELRSIAQRAGDHATGGAILKGSKHLNEAPHIQDSTLLGFVRKHGTPEHVAAANEVLNKRLSHEAGVAARGTPKAVPKATPQAQAPVAAKAAPQPTAPAVPDASSAGGLPAAGSPRAEWLKDKARRAQVTFKNATQGAGGAAKAAIGAGAAGVAGKMLYNAGRTAGHEAGHAAGLEAGRAAGVESAKMTTAQKGMLVGGGVVGGLVAGRALSN